jgi:arylsulfatase A-like enzyme
VSELPDDNRPNLILVTTDQQRYDTLGVTGNEQIRTPNLDALAGRGTLFRNAFVQNPVCIPSRACMQTGRYTHQHGVRYMETVIDTTPGLPGWEHTFMERLQAAGYETGAAGKIHMMPEAGFHHLRVCGGKGARWTESEGQEIGPGPLGPTYAGWLEERHPGGYERIYEQRRQPEYKGQMTAVVNVLPVEEYVDYWIAEEAIEFIQRERERPFFLWIGFCGPHGPMDPPRPYDELYPFDEVPWPRTLDAPGVPDNSFRRRVHADPTLMRRVISYYWALVTFIDDMMKRIDDTLGELGLWDNTLLAMTSDHGDMLGDRARRGKGNFYDIVTRVPTFVIPPGGKPGASDVTELVEAMDIAPTMLDYAGVEIPSVMQATSLRPLVEGHGGGHEAVLCEYTTNDQSFSGKCVRTERYKYCFWTGDKPDEFYDLEADPDELTNLIDDPACAQPIREHQEIMLGKLTESEKVF